MVLYCMWVCYGMSVFALVSNLSRSEDQHNGRLSSSVKWWLKPILVNLLIDKVEDETHILKLRVVLFLWIIH